MNLYYFSRGLYSLTVIIELRYVESRQLFLQTTNAIANVSIPTLPSAAHFLLLQFHKDLI